MPDDLTSEAFEALLRILHPDRDEAGKIYVELQLRLISFFERRRCECPEDLADETLKRIANNRLRGAEIRDLGHYAFGVAHRVAKELGRKAGSWRRILELYRSLLSRRPPEEDETMDDRRLETLRGCLEQLSPQQRDLIVKYHQGQGKDRIRRRKELARELGLDMNALRIRAHRLRQILVACMKKSMVR